MKKSNLKPEAYISIGKNRQKVYEGKNVFLQNNQEFSFEMFNPTADNVMARISINGKRISNNGIILRPGVRGWLDRYLDENRKFLFETYTVSNSKAVQQAIAENGLITIEFFKEKPMVINEVSKGDYYNAGPIDYYPFGRNLLGDTSGDSTNVRGIVDTSVSYSVSTTSASLKTPSKKRYKETGRIEKGGNSSQQFKTVDMNFEFLSFHSVEYKLLPESEKKIEINQVKLKCANCGTKIKQGWNVCPVCATPLNGKTKCEVCGEKLEPKWKVCPNCGEVI